MHLVGVIDIKGATMKENKNECPICDDLNSHYHMHLTEPGVYYSFKGGKPQ